MTTIKRISLRLTDDEMLELAQLRQALEQATRKTVTLQAALRTAIETGHSAGVEKLDFTRTGTDRDRRLELVIDEAVGAQLDALQAERPKETHSSIALACARITTRSLNAELAGSHARRKGDRTPRP